ncbi:propionate catabolism operon regulatory protein PrpR [Imbroritus primus]|uniref:Propionate catabolism operon regulatory protein PrpR n=1 Tax=Imbroritus primus TaxID=3058603 RepID=A0ACD3STR1_9BURK|nr:propionate catabolism operon regulatory protein PrpR [Burkholderiaceae bacterium PBA]
MAPVSYRPRIWAIGISRLNRAFAEWLPVYADQADFRILDKGFEAAAAAIAREVREGRLDAVVSGGANGAYLRQHVDIPVIVVKVTGFDVLNALATARQRSSRIALVTHAEVYPEVEAFCRAFALAIPAYTYRAEEDATALIQTLRQEGVEVVVGPGMVADLAERAGMAAVFLYSGSSVQGALEDAIEAVRLRRIEAGRREYVNAILAHLEEGVVAVDESGRIQSFNPAMERLLDMPAASVVGRRWQSLVPSLPLESVLESGTRELAAIHHVRGKTVVVNRIPLLSDGRATGAVLTMQDANAIHRADRSLRTRTRARAAGVRYTLDDLLGESPAMREVRALAQRYAQVDSTVLIQGESGTGKEVLAQGMHQASPRHPFPFVAVNCAAFPETLLESELFGYEEGAFSGARRGGKVGLIESAHNGTLFLDEVGDMPPALQIRLLRVLQERQGQPVGSLDAVPVNVRIIAATHRDLAELVRQGVFRQDLYFRLNILSLRVPPLRTRREDIRLVAEALFRRIQRRLQPGDPVPLPDILAQQLECYDWPGNIRELENVLERVAVLMAGGLEGVESLAQAARSVAPELFALPAPAAPIPTSVPVLHAAEALTRVSRASELAHIRAVLAAHGGRRNEAARALGISPTTLWRRLKAADAPDQARDRPTDAGGGDMQ